MNIPTLSSDRCSLNEPKFVAQRCITVVAEVVAVFLLVGCATNDARRINADVIAQSTPEQQEMIKRGKVAVGFTKEMVRAALGGPNLVQESTEYPNSEVWSYWSIAGLWRDTTRVIFREGTVAAMEIDSKRSQ